MKKISVLASFFVFCTLFGMALHSNINVNNGVSSIQLVYGHNFPANDYSKFIASLDQFQTESNLVKENLDNNNISLAQKHANEANSVYYWDLLIDVVKQDKNLGDELKSGIGDLRNSTIALSDKENSQVLKQQTIQQADKLITLINSNVDKIIADAAVLKQSENADPLNQISNFFSNLFGGANNTKSANDSIHPIRFADLLDSVLRNYGDAYGVKFDMTDMTNMAKMAAADSNSTSMNHSMADGSSSNMEHEINVTNASPIINMANYQSADVMAKKLLEIFDKELKPLMSSEDTTNQSAVLENGIRHLISSVENKESPLEIMSIVHSQIHPTLVQAFNLQIMPNP